MFQHTYYFVLALSLLVGCEQQTYQGESDTGTTETPITDDNTTDDATTTNNSTTDDTTTSNNATGNTTEDAATNNNTTESTTTNPNQTAADPVEVSQAICELVSIGESGVTGTIRFEKEGDTIHISGEVVGLTPGKHGFHVHEHGDLSDKETGKSAGGHFNPTNHAHGRPTDNERHVGDLGNIEAGEDGTATIDFTDDLIELTGENSIVGHSLVVHAEEDKFTQPTGDAGGRVAFGLIEVSE